MYLGVEISLARGVYTCNPGLQNLTARGEEDARGEDSLAKQQLRSGSFKPIPHAQSVFFPTGLQPSLVP